MKESEDRTIDFERDLPTTSEDVRALRSADRVGVSADLRHMNELNNPFSSAAAGRRRKTFRGIPPFEL